MTEKAGVWTKLVTGVMQITEGMQILGICRYWGYADTGGMQITEGLFGL
jgi:hypothetical protein